MPVSYDVKTSDGKAGTITAEQLMGDLQGMGAGVVGIDPSGESVKFRLSSGQEFDTPVNEVLGKFGYTVSGSKPLNPNYEALPESKLTGYRFAVGQLGDDDQKKQYLEMAIRRMTGDAKPKIMGSGQDFYYYSPDSGWTALTNKPGVDFSDIGEYGPLATKAAGAIGGAVIGGGAGSLGMGVGAIPGAMVGAGAGSAMTNALLRGSLLVGDDDFAKVTSPGEQAMQALPEVAIDTALPGATGLIGKVGGPAIRKLMSTGPVSTVGSAVSGFASGAGRGIQKVAKTVQDSPLLRDIYSAVNPATSSAQLYGWLAQIPSKGIKAGANVAARAGESPVAKSILGENLAGKVGSFGKELIETKAPTAVSEKFRTIAQRGESPAIVSAKNLIRRIRKQPIERTPILAEEASSKEILGKLGEKAGRSMSPEVSRETLTSGIPYTTEAEYQKALGKRLLDLNEKTVSRTQTGKSIGTELGRGIEAVGKAGEAAAGFADAATKAQLYGARGIGRGMELGGRAFRPIFRAAQPVENLGYARYFAQKYGQPMAEENFFGFAPSQRRRLPGTLNGSIDYAYQQN